MEDLSEPVDFVRKNRVIGAMLDEIYPFKQGMPDNVVESVDTERQILVMRAGWNAMRADELEALWLQGHDALPLVEE